MQIIRLTNRIGRHGSLTDYINPLHSKVLKKFQALVYLFTIRVNLGSGHAGMPDGICDPVRNVHHEIKTSF